MLSLRFGWRAVPIAAAGPAPGPVVRRWTEGVCGRRGLSAAAAPMTDGRARYTKLPALEKAEEEEDPAAAAADETRLRKAAVDEEWVPAPERAEDPDGMRTAERGGWKAAARASLA